MKRTLKLVLYYFGYQILFTFVVMAVKVLAIAAQTGDISAIIDATSPGGGLATDPTVLSIGVLLAALMMLWHLYHFKYVATRTSYLKAENMPVLLLCIPFIYTLSYLTQLLSECINLPNLLEDSFIDMSNNVWGIISIAIVAPILEECLFRGAIEKHLLKLWQRPWLAIVVSALVFGLVHMNPAQSVFAFFIGIVLGWLYWRTGSVMPSIVGHILNNSIAVISMRRFGAEGSFEQLAGEAAQPYFVAAYAVILVVTLFFIYKKTTRRCNFSEDVNV